MSVQCGSMNWSTTTLPRRLDRLSVWPFWSVRVKPGARSAGIGLSTMRLARLVDTLAGMPDTRACCAASVAWFRLDQVGGDGHRRDQQHGQHADQQEQPGQAAAPGRRRVTAGRAGPPAPAPGCSNSPGTPPAWSRRRDAAAPPPASCRAYSRPGRPGYRRGYPPAAADRQPWPSGGMSVVMFRPGAGGRAPGGCTGCAVAESAVNVAAGPAPGQDVPCCLAILQLFSASRL